MKPEIKRNIATVIVITLLVGWCAMPDEEITASEIISVSDYENNLNEQPAVSVTFGESDANHCSFTILRKNIKAGYSINSVRGNNYDSLSFDCNWGGVWYIQNSNLDTYAQLEIMSLDHANKSAEILMSAKLKEYKKIGENPSGDTAELNEVKLVITGKHFENLTKKI